MKYSTVYVGMDVHKETFSLCCYTNEKEQAEYPQKVDGHYNKVINYIEAISLNSFRFGRKEHPLRSHCRRTTCTHYLLNRMS